MMHIMASAPLTVYRKRCTGEGGVGRLAWQNGPAQWAEHGNRTEAYGHTDGPKCILHSIRAEYVWRLEHAYPVTSSIKR